MVGMETYGYNAGMAKKTGAAGYDVPEGVDIRGRYDGEFAKILTKDALQFVAGLQREFRNHIKYVMECRKEAKERYNSGGLPGFDPATKYVREGEWTCAPVPSAVADRRVEITGPVERKMIINALNSGAKVFMVCAVFCLYCDCMRPCIFIPCDRVMLITKKTCNLHIIVRD